eukprot:CAMPEP_0204425008 /NCGR_PEP_ID=MMETSP0470-20130426/47764_1 /ASSEMBLY_ACC=CAM_ASM_000385 /TAXON_ID=2969 /ORGANISM="Oxyrrhis marina" /LENGTH=32 /DNA_ID= /DNA_START= /DNA_END= /DNA_ORIENTATION=
MAGCPRREVAMARAPPPIQTEERENLAPTKER